MTRHRFALLLVDPEVVPPRERGDWPRSQERTPERVWLAVGRTTQPEDDETAASTLSVPPTEAELERFLGHWQQLTH